jgi:hypothetical protein
MYSASLPATVQLRGLDRARFFAPAMFFGALALLCLGLIALSPFLVTIHDAIAIAAAGVFGLLATGAAAALILRLQLRWLRYASVPLGTDAATARGAIHRLAAQAGWRITRENATSLEARTTGTLFDDGERICIEIGEHELRVASLCDPTVGFSLVGQRRCRQHCEQVRRAVMP